MRAPLSWLRDYAPLEGSVEDLATALSELGLVVEGVEQIGAGLGDVVVAKVEAIRPHPDADRIRLVDVDAGGGDTLQIVCGAWNFSEGDLVPLAPAGAVLPGGFEISRRKMRGEWSNGMLCSAPELELPEQEGSAGGLLILPAGLAAPGTPLVEAMGLHPDVVFDLDVSPNRPDALCMAGIARDLAARLGQPWTLPAEPAPPAPSAGVPDAVVSVECGDLCPRFTGTVIEGVPQGPSPAWIARRLTMAGMRPINAVVDVSNYVMLDLGQPNHAYDLDRLGGGGILVRRGRPGETLVTLDGVERSLQPGDCVIADANGDGVGVGGIMGGADSEISGSTSRVLLEAAWFTPMAIARTGKRLGLGSEARSRFERGVDPDVTLNSVERFVGLLASVAGAGSLRRGRTTDVVDSSALPATTTVQLRVHRVNSLLGTDLQEEEVVSLLEPIGFKARGAGDSTGSLDVTIPSWRLDSDREIDVVEEVARMWGYERIDRTVPSGAAGRVGGLTRRQRERRQIRQVLAGAGFDEAWTTTFLAPGDLERAGLDPRAVEVENPLDRSESILRTSLLPGLLKAARFNRDRQAGDIFLFEIGRVFALPAGDQATPEESEHLGVIIAPASAATANSDGSAAYAAAATWRTLSEALGLEHGSMTPEQTGGWHPARAVKLAGPSGSALGVAGEVDPDVLAAYGIAGRVGFLSLSLDAVYEHPRLPREAKAVSRFPASDIDLAFVVAEPVLAAEVRKTLDQSAGDVLEDVWLFDVFRGVQIGDGNKSLAFRLRFRASDRTLGESELADLRKLAIESVTARFEASLRS
ncbi:MAG TPA: phenylalanine--tRNA ligase subunit beta [Acidimicrobiales bacterium]|nr:phenylalanine--tRNA ligase subunit beta [Acidimicrobiales bacterium]